MGLVLAILLVTSLAGCASFETRSYKVLTGVASTVNISRLAWNDYVAQGHATTNEVIAVRAEYLKYQSAMNEAHVLVDTYQATKDKDAVTRSIGLVTSASLAVVNTIAIYQNR